MSAPHLDAAIAGFGGRLGLRLTEITPDRVVAQLQVTPAHFQSQGVVHGGVYCSVVETLASVGANKSLDGKGRAVGMSNHTNFLRMRRHGLLRVEALAVHQGRTQQLWHVEIRDQESILVTQGEVRLANVYGANSGDVQVNATGPVDDSGSRTD